MPVVIRTRSYDEQFYAEIGDQDWESRPDSDLFVAAQNARLDLGI